MEQRLDYVPPPDSGVRNLSGSSAPERLSELEQDVKALISALALLGVKRCAWCRQFFRSSEPGALFENGEIVCYECIPDWWASRSPTLGIVEREKIEGKLSSWLRRYHRAEVVKEIPENARNTAAFQIVTTCGECRGVGKLLEGERCRFCSGNGTVWIVVPR